jgi:hypothetical protein
MGKNKTLAGMVFVSGTKTDDCQSSALAAGGIRLQFGLVSNHPTTMSSQGLNSLATIIKR